MYKIKITCTYGGQWYKSGEQYDVLPDAVKPFAELLAKVEAVDKPATKRVTKDAKPKNAK